MTSINTVIIAGHLTRDPEVRFVTADRAVAKFALAINESWKDKASGEKKERVTFVECEAWGKTGELVGQYLAKGRGACVEGKLQLDQWEKDGVKQSRLKVVAERVHFLRGKGEASDHAPAKAASGGGAPVIDDSSIPF